MLDQPAGTTQPSTTARRERLQARLAGDAGGVAPLDGATIFAILRRRKWLLLASMLLCPLLAVVAITQLTPRYTATGTMLYDASEYKARELESIMRVDPITDAVMASQAEVLRGMPVVEQVASRLNLPANPEFNASLRPRLWLERALSLIRRVFAPAADPDGDLPGPRLDPDRNATLRAVRAALTVTPVKASHVLEVSFTAEDPVIAAAGANNAMDVYVKAQLGAKYGAVAKAREWLEQRRDELRRDVRREEDAIAQYRARNGLVEGMHARLGSEQISLLTENLEHARNTLAEAEAKLDAPADGSAPLHRRRSRLRWCNCARDMISCRQSCSRCWEDLGTVIPRFRPSARNLPMRTALWPRRSAGSWAPSTPRCAPAGSASVRCNAT